VRKAEADAVREKHPDRIPVNCRKYLWNVTREAIFFEQVIVEKVASSRIADLDRKKFLVPSDLTGKFYKFIYYKLFNFLLVAQFMHVLRQRIQLDATESIFLMVNGVQPATR